MRALPGTRLSVPADVPAARSPVQGQASCTWTADPDVNLPTLVRAADRHGTRALGAHSVWLSPVPLGPAPLATASLQVPPGTSFQVPPSRDLPPGPSLQSSFRELCWLLGPPRGSRSTRRLLRLDAWCFHAHLVAAVLTEHLEQLRRPGPPWPHPAHALPAEAFSQRCCQAIRLPRRGQGRSSQEHGAPPAHRPAVTWPEPRAPGHCDLTSVTGPLGVPPAQPRRTHGALQEGRECRAPAGQAGVSPGAPHSRNPGQAVLGPPWWTLSCLRSSGRAQPPGTSRCSALHSRGPPSPSELPGGPAAGLLPRLARSAPRFVSIFRDHRLVPVHTSGPQQAAALSPLLRG